MRHRKKGRKLGRTAAHKKAMMANLATALIEKESIRTTDTKAKELRGFVDRLVTFAKRGDLHARRQALKVLRRSSVVNKLFDDLAPRFVDRPGGYTRIVKLGHRKGDGAFLSLMEFVGEAEYVDGQVAEETPEEVETEKTVSEEQ